MSNGIGSRQNEGKCIRMLAAQRQLYSEVGHLDVLNIVLVVAFPLVLAVLLDKGSSWNWIGYVSYGLSFAMLWIPDIITKTVKNKKSTAASIQMAFDTYVFSMPWDERLFGKRKDLKEDISTKSIKIMKNRKQRNALKDWYTPVVDKMSLEKGILACQRENYRWDAGLRKRYKIAITIIISALIAIVFINGIYNNESFREVISRIIFVLPMYRWLTTTRNGLTDDLSRLRELDREFRAAGGRSMSDLQVIQRDISDHRKAAIKIPNVVYRIFKNNDEDREHRIAMVDVE